jgi:hypothetical protein
VGGVRGTAAGNGLAGAGNDTGGGGGGGSAGAIRVPSGQGATLTAANASPAPP